MLTESGPTDCRSAAASAAKTCQNANDLVREAVGCNGGLGAPVTIARVARRMCRPHPHTITPSTTGVDLNYAQHTITFHTTGNQHHRPSYHTRHNGQRHDEPGTTGMRDTRFAAAVQKGV